MFKLCKICKCEQKNYNLGLLEDDVGIKFAFRRDWLKQELNKPKILMHKISQTGDSEVYIEEVARVFKNIDINAYKEIMRWSHEGGII